MVEINNALFNIIIILSCLGTMAIVFSIVIMTMFWRLFFIQLKIWTLAKKGYVEIDHVREDNVIKVYYMRPKDDHFEFDEGVYLLQKDAITKRAEFLRKVPKELLDKVESNAQTAEEKELKEFKENSKDWKYNIDSVTLRWGIPTVFYYGKDPNPINFRNRNKIYDAKVFSAYIQRILLNKEWKLVRLALIVGMIAIGVSILLGFGFFAVASNMTKNNGICIAALNTTIGQYTSCMNNSLSIALQSSSYVV